MCPAPPGSTPDPGIDLAEPRADLTVEWCTGILMGVHRCGPNAAADLLRRVAGAHDCDVRALAVSTVELVRGAPPSDPSATVVAMRFLMGRAAYDRPVLDGQVHASVRDAAADMHPGPDSGIEALLLAADDRDSAAERRDRAAAFRDEAAERRARDSASDPTADAEGVSDREQAALDRTWAAADRDMSAIDRAAFVDRVRHRSRP